MIQTTIRLPLELHRKLKRLAKARGVTLNGFIIECLWRAAGGGST